MAAFVDGAIVLLWADLLKLVHYDLKQHDKLRDLYVWPLPKVVPCLAPLSLQRQLVDLVCLQKIQNRVVELAVRLVKLL